MYFSLRRPRGHSPVVCHKALAEAELAENVYHNLHGRVVGDGERAHVKDAAEFQGPWAVRRKSRSMRGKIHTGIQHYSLLLTARTFCRGRNKSEEKQHYLHHSTAP